MPRRTHLIAACAGVVLATLPATASAVPLWPTYHQSPSRAGANPAEPLLTGASQQWGTALDAQVQAEPLYVDGTIVAATENDTVYSLDASNGGVRWSRHLGTPRTSNLPCGNISPLGITGTPVVDGGTVFVVAEIEDSPTAWHWDLVALGLGDGAVRWRVRVNPPGLDPNVQQQRGALALAGGRVVVAWGGLAGDCGGYHGWVASFPESGTGTLRWATTTVLRPGGREGGIWAPPGPSVDAAQNVYVAVGNGSSTDPTQYDGSDSVVKLTPDMQPLDLFAPTSWPADNAGDRDLGSMSPMLLPNGMLFQAGKSGMGYLVNQQALGGVSAGAFAAQVCSGEAIGGAAYDGGVVYVACSSGLQKVRIDSTTHFTAGAGWSPPSGVVGSPVLAGGLVWSISLAVGGTTPPYLWGLDPGSGAPVVQLSLIGGVPRFTTPTIAGGRIYIVGGGNRILAFQAPLRPAPHPGGQVLDGWGTPHPYAAAGGATPEVGFTGWWPGYDVVRGAAQRPDRGSGYVLDLYGGLHPYGPGATTVAVTAYWPGFDIARGVALDPCGSGASGWVLDGWGGVHPFGGAPAVTITGYWQGWDIARAIAVNACSGGRASGYVLDGWGNLHPFAQSGAPVPPQPAQGNSWPGWDIARGLVVSGPGQGYVLDGWGGMAPFGGAPAPAVSARWQGWDIARAVSWDPVLHGGVVLDGWGGVHGWVQTGNPPVQVAPSVTFPGYDIARAVTG